MDLVVFQMALQVLVQNPIYFVVLFFNLANVNLLGEVEGTFVWVEYPGGKECGKKLLFFFNKSYLKLILGQFGDKGVFISCFFGDCEEVVSFY